MSALEACQGRLHCGVHLLFIQQIPHSTGHCLLLGKFQTTSSSQTSTEAEIADRTCSIQLLSDREASLPIHTDVPSNYLPTDGRQIGEVCQTSPERSTRIPLLGDPLWISGILTSGPEKQQAVGRMFGLTSAVLLHE